MYCFEFARTFLVILTHVFVFHLSKHLKFAEEVILAEERTTEEERMHIMEGNNAVTEANCFQKTLYCLILSARRRNAAKRKKLKSLGKSKSTDTEEEEGEEDYGDDGMFQFIDFHCHSKAFLNIHIQKFSQMCSNLLDIV